MDAAVFALVGRQMARGLTPYADVWDHKPPLVYLLDAFAALAGPAQWVVVWTMSVIACATIGVVAAAVLRAVTTPLIAAIVAFATALLGSQYLLTLGGGLTEPIAAAVAGPAFALAVTTTRPRVWFAIGALLGCAALASPQIAPALLAVAYVAWMGGPGRVRRFMLLLAGGLALGGAAVAAILAAGVGDAAFDALGAYNRAYVAATSGDEGAFALLPWTVLALLPLIAAAVIGIGRLRAVPGAGVFGAAAIAWMVGTVIMTVLQNRFFAHYAVAAVLPLALLAGVGLHDVFVNGSRPRQRLGGLAAVVVVLISLPAAVAGGRQEAVLWAAANDLSARVSEVVRGHSAAGDRIFVWGNGPWVYLDADRRPASRFVYLLPLTTPGYGDGRSAAGVVDELRIAMPAVVVDTGSRDPIAGFPALDADLGVHGSDVQALKELQTFIRDHYSLVDTVDGWSIHTLVSP